MQESLRAGRTGDVLAVVSQSGPTVSFFDAASDRLLGTIEVLAEPHELCFDPARRLLWCTTTYRSGYYHDNGGGRSELTVIDPDARQVVDVVDLDPERAPHGLALDAERGLLFVSVEAAGDRPGGVVVIDAATRRPIGRIDTGARGPHWFVVTPDGSTGYASNKEAPFVSVVDLVAGTLIDRIDVPGSEGLAVSGDGSRVYVAAPYAAFGYAGARRDPGIRVIDTTTRSIVDTVATENVVVPVHLTTGGQLLAGQVRVTADIASGLAHQKPGLLSVYSPGDHRTLGSVEVGRCPLTITSSPDGGLGYVSGVIDSTVDIIDLATVRRVARLDIAKLGEPGAHGLAYLPKEN